MESDPPVYALGGVPRCIFGTFAGYQRALEIADSPHIGVCLCVGCWLEDGRAGLGCGAIEAVRHFGGQGKEPYNKQQAWKGLPCPARRA